MWTRESKRTHGRHRRRASLSVARGLWKSLCAGGNASSLRVVSPRRSTSRVAVIRAFAQHHHQQHPAQEWAAEAAAPVLPEVAEAAPPGISPSLKNFLLSTVSGGVVLIAIVGAVVVISNFDPA
ncbi:hypothetical protein BAE44_0000612 [Dichanthelium oligosanthes]|uniref:Photosystem II reaction center X protein n=1 Tax=Dichanthelium oligosanthes TaxID=888268 RepID=A0A1E5WLS6_9POAL|nr:hypothetical protein BAE44_0000612 [Dichanthelium oligosanthes]